MSNYALQSELSAYERELSQTQAITRELQGELSIVANGVNRANNELENFNAKIRNSLDNCDGTMKSSHHRVIDAVELQGEIERLYVRFKNVELANKKIRACNNKKYYDFSNYRTVRKIVQGIMDNLEMNMVSDQMITKSVEIQHLQAPDYWLTCALISIMAWRNDDKELSDQAMARAIKLDKKNSSVFYMLFNLRMLRDEAALKWFYTYQECDLKGSDQRTFLMLFSLVSKMITENVDEKTRNEISSFINKIIANNAQAEGYSEEDVINQIKIHLNRMKPNEQIEYAMLRKCCTAFGDLQSIMMEAKNNINILQFIINTVNVSAEQKNDFLKEYIDELIASPNQAEESVYDEIAYNELVIKLGGDVETAKIQYEQEATRIKNELNLIPEMITWIYEKDVQDVNGQIRLNMFTLTKEFQEKAVEGHFEDYRRRRTNTLPITIGEYSTSVNFKHEDEEFKKIEKHYIDIRNNGFATIKNWKAYISFGVAVAAVAGAFFAGFWLFALTAVGAGYGVFVLFSNKAQRKQLELTCKDNIRNTSEQLQKLVVEFKQYQKELDEYDAYAEKIVNELNKL